MCRLFGFRSAIPSRAHRSLLEAENALIKQASCHQDGWGIGYFIGRDAYILKSERSAHTCERFRLASSRLQSHTFVVHVRKATVGQLDYMNSHPFRFGRWIFAHNGTIHDFERFQDWIAERTHPEHRPLIFGSTDSEHLFHYLLTALGEAGFDRSGHAPIDTPVAARVLRSAISEIFARSGDVADDFPITNFILTNGEVFFAMRAGKELFMATQKSSCADFGTCPEPRKVCMESIRPDNQVNHLIVSSERIGSEDLWEELEQGAMVAMGADFKLHFLPPFEQFGLSRIAS